MPSPDLPAPEPSVGAADLSDLRQRGNLRELERQLYAYWELGRNLVLGWCRDGAGLLVLVVPHQALAAYPGGDAPVVGGQVVHDFVLRLLTGPRQFSTRQLHNAARLLGTEPRPVLLRHPLTGSSDEQVAIERLVARFGVSYVPDRAVALFDIVGFSLLSPFEQMTQRNSLSCSLNSAHARLLARRMRLSFARMTTGDGFYIWNRDTGLDANTNLYHFMHLVLADNAICRQHAADRTVPLLRTSFHIGGCYEYHHAEGLNPTVYTDIVGDVTIELARIIEGAMPGQILVGEFDLPMAIRDGDPGERFDSVRFLEHAAESLAQLNGLELSGDAIESIKCYLTGAARSDGTFTIRKLAINDKHGLTRNAYNAKVNIHRRGAAPILLGIEDRLLQDDVGHIVTAAHLVRSHGILQGHSPV